MSKSKMPDITVVLPTLNRGDILFDTIQDVLSQGYKNLELVVVDQTKDISSEIMNKIENINDPRLRYFFVDPASLTAARNFALEKAHSDIVLYIDDDVKLTKNFVTAHIEAFKKHPEVAAVAGRVMQEGFPVKEDVLRFDDLAVSEGVFTATKPAYTNAFPGGNCALRKVAALKVGGFDTRYYGNFFREESDMSLKMTKAGMKIFFEPKAELLHLAAPRGGTRTQQYLDIRDTEMFYRNELFFTLRMANKKMSAIRFKFDEYCKSGGKLHRRRAAKFALGILAAYWRMIFGRQIVAKERES